MKINRQQGQTGLARRVTGTALGRRLSATTLWAALCVSLWALTTSPAAAQPVNNDFVDADVLFGGTGTIGGDTTGATAEVGEPPHFGASVSSVWYRWTAPNSGLVTFDTIGSGFDTVLAAYRGTNLTTLQKIVSNDDMTPDSSFSRITFQTVAGVEYYIAVDGFQGAFGSYVLSWAPGDTPAAPLLSTGNFEFTAMEYDVTEFETSGAPYAPGNPSLDGRSPPGAVITVTRLGGMTGKVSVDYETVPGGGTGVDGVDYVDTRGTLHFDDFQTSARFMVPVLSDLTSNETKTVMVQLSLPQIDVNEDQSLPAPGLGFISSAMINIIEIERGITETNFNIERINYSMQEGAGNVEVDVVLTGENGGPGEVDFVVNPNGGGVVLNAGSDIALPGPNPFQFPDTAYTDGFTGIVDQPDYLPATTRLTFGPGQRRATVVVEILDDNQVEFTEDLLVFLRPVANSPGLGPSSAARVTIMNDDPTAGALDREWNPDGVPSTTPRFNATPGANNTVRALAIQPDLRTVLGGDFSAYNSTPRNFIARINPDGSNDDTFNPGTGADGYVTSLALYTNGANAGKVLVGGGFSSMNNIQRNGVARLNADGSLDNSFAIGTGANGVVRSVALQDDGQILIAGDFTEFNGITRNGVARLNPSGSLDTGFDPGLGADGTVWSVAFQAPFIYIGGEFINFDGAYRGGVARLSADGSLDQSYDPGGGAEGAVYSVLPQSDGRLLVGGFFPRFDFRQRGNLARLEPDGRLDLTYDPGTGANDAVYSLALQADGKALAGGQFTVFNGTRRMGLTRLFVNGTVDTSFLDTAYNQFAGLINTYHLSAPNYVNSVALQPDGNVMIGGSFTNVGGHSSAELNLGRYFIDTSLSGRDWRQQDWSRSDKRPRYNVARLLGGYTPGPGNLETVAGTYTVDEHAGFLAAAFHRVDGRLGTAMARAETRDDLAVAGLDFDVGKGVGTWSEASYPAPISVGFVDELYFVIPINGDSLVEGDELFDIAFSNPQGSIQPGGEFIPLGTAIGRPRAMVTIVDDDFQHGTLVFGAPTYATNENARIMRFSVVRTNGSSGLISVRYFTRGGTAVSGQDFTGVNVGQGTLTFGSGVINQTININLTDDNLVEPDEMFSVTLTNATGGAIIPGSSVTATGIIIDDDLFSGKVNFSSATFATNENSLVAQISLVRLGGSLGELSADVSAAAGSATAGTDFTAVTTNIVWVDGDVGAKIFYVPLASDFDVEPNETVALTLSNPSIVGGIGAIGAATLTLVNDDFPGVLTFSQPYYDADERGTNVSIIVNRVGGVGGTVSVNYTIADGTAFNGIDFIAASGTLTFGPGVIATNFDVELIDNGLTDGERTNTMTLTLPTGGATIGLNYKSILRISDDESIGDPAGSLDTIFSPLAGGTNAIHSLLVQPDGKVLVGGEFRSLNRVFRNRIGRLNEDGSIDETFDPLAGPNGAVRAVALQSDGRVLIGGFFSSVHGTNRSRIARLLADGTVDRFFNPGAGADNPVYALAVEMSGRILMGGAFATVNGISRRGIAALEPEGTVSTTFNPGVGADGTVFAIAVQQDGKILIGGDFASYNGVGQSNLVRLMPDGMLDTTFATGAGPDGSVRAITLQADGRILIGGAFTNYDGTARGRLARLLPTGALDSAFMTSVDGANGDVAAIALQYDTRILVAGDFTTFNGVTRNRITRLNRNGKTDPTINFGDGANESINTLIVQQDRKIIIGGRFTAYNNTPRFFLARIYGGSIAGPGRLEFSAPLFTALESDGDALITVVRRGGTTSDVTIDYASAGGSATPGVDYTAVSSTLTFPEGETRRTFLVPLINDFIGEPSETVQLSLSNPTPGLGTPAIPNTTLIIVNDDSGVGFGSASYSVNENVIGSALMISVLRTGATNGTTSVDFATVNGTAGAPQDYGSRTGTLTFLPGQTVQSFTVPIVDDNNIESGETFTIILSNLVGTAALSVPSTTVTIVDNDFQVGSLVFSSESYSVTESAGNVNVTVLRTNGTTGAITFDYAVIAGTASPGSDYVPQSGTLSLVEGQTSITISVAILDDALVEGDESFFVALSNPGGGAVILGSTNATVLILDEEFGPGSVDRTFDPGTGTDGLVRSLAVQPSGKVLLGGAFTRFNGTNRNHIVRLNADGSLDDTFDPGAGPNALVSGVASGPNGKVLIGGSFDAVDGVNFNRIGQLNDDGSPDLTFSRVVPLNASVYTVTVQTNGRVLIGGAFSLPTRGIARLFENGNVDSSMNVGSGVDGAVHVVVEAPDGSLFLGGAFGNVNGEPRNRVAKLTSGGLLDTSFGTGAIVDGTVFSLAIQSDGKIVVAGDFQTATGTNRTRLARLNSDGTLDPTFNPGAGANATVYAVGLQTNGQAVIAGDFTSVNGTNRNRFARLNIDGSLDTAFDPGRGANNTVFSLAVLPNDEILIAGDFTEVGGLSRQGVARIRGGAVGPSPLAFAAVSVSGSMLRLSTRPVTGQPQPCVLEWSSDLTHWSPIATNHVGTGSDQFLVPINHSAAAGFFRVRSGTP